MTGIYDAVADQGIIYIIDRCPDVAGIIVGGILVELLSHNNIIGKNTCDLLLQYMISQLLQVLVNGQVNIITGYRLNPGILIDLQYFAQVVNRYLLLPVFSLQGGLHVLLNSCFADHSICGVVRIIFF